MQAPAFLIIQTAFIGDVVLATALVEKLHQKFPDSPIDFLLRKGNEDLLKGHPFLRSVLIWDKKKGKVKNLFRIIRSVRAKKYDYLINVHRFTSSGLITFFSGAKVKIGFDKNPLSFTFTKKIKHTIAPGVHEIFRNQGLISGLTDGMPAKPRLYPSPDDYTWTLRYQRDGDYVCIAPTSVWFTKQFPGEKWTAFIDQLGPAIAVFLLGGPSDKAACEAIRLASNNKKVINLAGELSYLESAALMQHAMMNYVNDSAPVHFASSVNAPVTALFCSTIPDFGFGPLSDKSYIVETEVKLSCRPCGLHGYKTCPQGHFKCALTIETKQLIASLPGA